MTLVSDQEANLLSKTLSPGEHPIHGVANGVDTQYFSPQQWDDAIPVSADDKLQSPKLVFVGVMNYPPNVEALHWFVENVWSPLRQRYPKANLEIVGKHPSPSILQLARHDGIEVTGAVPDVRPHVAKADMVIAPLQIARGVQNKVLEAMSMARPVVSSPDAATGIDAVDGNHLLIAQTPQEWLTQIGRLCSEPMLRERLATNARQLICERYTWQATLAGLDRLLTRHLPASA